MVQMVRLIVALVAVAFAAPGAAGQVHSQAVECEPPCGWINPLIAMDFDDKPRCRNLDDCLTPPAPGEEVTMQGLFSWYWEMSEDGTYLDDATTDIIVSFSGTASNPSWLDFTVEPESFAITSADLFTPTYMETRGEGPEASLWYNYQVPLTVTFTRTGDPTPAELERIQDRAGVQNLFVKAKSTESSDRFKAAFGVEEFRFLATEDPVIAESMDEGIPAPGLLVGVGGLVAAAFAARRRQG